MPQRTDKNAKSRAELQAGPKSFVPQSEDPSVPNAWDSLRELSKRTIQAGGSAEQMCAWALSELRARHQRFKHLPGPMFGEPAWDMLLSLYVNFMRDVRLTISKLSEAAGAPSTTALRWIVYLEKEGLAQRRLNPLDKRVVFVELSEKGRNAVEAYLVDLLRDGSAHPGSAGSPTERSPQPG